MVLHFYTSCHIKEKCVECFFVIILFLLSTLVRKENIKRPGFYTLKVTSVLPNFLQLKQLNKIKNTCKYCDLLELRTIRVGDSC